ncbi:zinc transporter ZIP1-like isoform X2 [Chelonus insularis]|uniref:zinc transporter ZIP1-like isoform X2 n=1 Tax=Chelonus insularis TaxID=460826 RepID=UPI00158A9E66|nr:zinc transporter ZIP1-like isoform X2 [Chelonus insularis]XP_034934317.1 zinc transporter ZIP1-like isoform X2 [Chelonus insularis]XP_034934319.1 zinc transporter ZIP1-like isoform X2 [Chelonus insularis]XP_034934320.1 zinc transporter ZIP1-like isoform X2 [Chelonus insularis]
MAPHQEEIVEFFTQKIDSTMDAHDDHNPTAVLTAKAVTMVVLCVVSTIMGSIPLQLSKCFKWGTDKNDNPRSSRIVGMLLGFGGGVLFCTTFLHMLPEVKENVESLVDGGILPDYHFPWAETFVCTGFFIMYLVEEIVHTKLRQREQHEVKHVEKDVNHSTNELVENNGCVVGHGHSHGYGHGHTHLPAPVMTDHHDFVISSLRGLLIVLGLSVHELFEGLAIGLEGSANYVWYMFAAVAAHKFVIAFCIGVELVASRTHQCLSVIYVCTFAIVSPMGIGIGMLLVGGGSTAASGPLPVILQGIATGTLLYVVFFEILHHNRDGLHQYLSIIIGFMVMFGLQIATAHSHSHSHSHGGGHEHLCGVDEHEDHDHHDHHNPSVKAITENIDRISSTVADAVTNIIASTTTRSNPSSGHS